MLNTGVGYPVPSLKCSGLQVPGRDSHCLPPIPLDPWGTCPALTLREEHGINQRGIDNLLASKAPGDREWRQDNTRAESPSPWLKLHCCTGLHSQNINSKIQLLSVSRQQPKSIQPWCGLFLSSVTLIVLPESQL